MITIAPYLWLAGLNGKSGVFGREPVHVSASFSEVFDILRFGSMAVTQLHNGTWGVFGDFIYVKTEDEESVTRSLMSVPTSLTAIVETSSFTGTLMGAYRVYSTPSAFIDVMAGARLWNVDDNIRLTLTQGGPSIAHLSGSDGSTWVDPMLGVKGQFGLSPSWYVDAWGMVGGLGMGSEVTWDALIGVGYRWHDWLSIVGGYRALGVRYDHDGFLYEVIQHGPILGAVFHF